MSGALPCGGQRGTTAVVQVDGKNLQGATAFLSGHGARIESVTVDVKGEQATLKLAIASDAPLGPRELRIGTAKGVSNPLRLWVDAFPETQETEPNDVISQAQALPRTPVVVNGRIQAPTDRDVFAFQVEAGETWAFDCNAARLRSRLDPVLELRDGSGQILHEAQSVWENDPRLIYRFARAGRYFLTVRDTQFLGGSEFLYRLTVGRLPVITGFLPRGVPPGRATTLTVQGVNLGATSSITVSVPADMPEGEAWIAPETANGPALPIPLQIDSSVPAVPVSEAETATPFPKLPCFLDGAFLRSPHHRFTFSAQPTEKLIFDLLGRRLGSRIDGALRILDATGKEIAANDDAVGKDARLEFALPTAGTYTLEVANVEEKTGSDCFYRLSVFRAAPDFRLMLNTERLTVGAGGTVAIPITVERLHGFAGAITVHAEGLPSGVFCRGGALGPGQNQGELTLTAPPGTTLAPLLIHLRGEATLNGKTVTREVESREQYLPRLIDPGLFTDDSYRRPYRICDLLPLGIVERAEPFALETSVTALTLAPGQKIEFIVRALRQPKADGEIKLELRGVPEKVKADAPPISAGKNEVRVTLTAPPDAPAALRNLIILGHLGSATQSAPAIVLTVHR